MNHVAQSFSTTIIKTPWTQTISWFLQKLNKQKQTELVEKNWQEGTQKKTKKQMPNLCCRLSQQKKQWFPQFFLLFLIYLGFMFALFLSIFCSIVVLIFFLSPLWPAECFYHSSVVSVLFVLCFLFFNTKWSLSLRWDLNPCQKRGSWGTQRHQK